MIRKLKRFSKVKHLFRSYYCLECKQKKSCQLLSSEYCCSCYYQQKAIETQEYANYQQVYQQKVQEKKGQYRQYQLLKNYQLCHNCQSLAVDAYELYENNKLVCHSCLMKKESGGSSPVSFLERRKWFRKNWKIELEEWLEKFQCLPINANCAKKWLKNKEHLSNCACLEQESQELHELFINSLKRCQKQLKKCACEKSEKPRTPYYDSANYGYTYCEKCETIIKGAGKMGIIKNRNNPNFWGLKIVEKVLCGSCLTNYQEKMSTRKKYLFSEYQKRYNF